MKLFSIVLRMAILNVSCFFILHSWNDEMTWIKLWIDYLCKVFCFDGLSVFAQKVDKIYTLFSDLENLWMLYCIWKCKVEITSDLRLQGDRTDSWMVQSCSS